jgi:cysteine synthase B
MSILDAIGNTPLVEIKNIWNPDKTGVRILAKLEGSNPGGSVKDRPAYYMIKEAVESGALTKDKIILEPTSGNTGIGLAMIAAAMGYRISSPCPQASVMRGGPYSSHLALNLNSHPDATVLTEQ